MQKSRFQGEKYLPHDSKAGNWQVFKCFFFLKVWFIWFIGQCFSYQAICIQNSTYLTSATCHDHSFLNKLVGGHVLHFISCIYTYFFLFKTFSTSFTASTAQHPSGSEVYLFYSNFFSNKILLYHYHIH